MQVVLTESDASRSYFSRLETEKILGCSRQKLDTLEREGRLHRLQINGRGCYAAQEVRDLLEEIEMDKADEDQPIDENDAADAPAAGASMEQTSVSIIPTRGPIAEMMRAASASMTSAHNGHRSLMTILVRALNSAHTRIAKLEDERPGLLERIEKLSDKSVERNVELKFAELLLEQANPADSAGEKIVTENVQPLLDAIMDRVRGVKRASTTDITARKVRNFFGMLRPDQFEALKKILDAAQAAVLTELIDYLKPTAEEVAASSPA